MDSHTMLGKTGAIAVAVVAIVLFAGMTYFTLEKSKPNLNLVSAGYMSVRNDTQSVYFVSTATKQIQLNFTIFSSVVPTSVFMFDISPLNNSSAVTTWQNLTYLGQNGANYEKLSVTANGTAFSVALMLNDSAVGLMKISNPANGTFYPYVVKIIFISSGINFGGFGLALVRVQ